MKRLFNPTIQVQFCCTDPDEFQEKANGWDIDHLQLTPGKYRTSMEFIYTQNIQISDVTHYIGIHEKGGLSAGTCVISLPTPLDKKPLYYCGKILKKDECPALLPGQEFDTLSYGGMNYISIVADMALLDREAVLLTGQPFSSMVKQQRVCIPQQDQQLLIQSITSLMRSLHKPSHNLGIEQQLLEKQFIQQLLLFIRLPQKDYASLPNRRTMARRAELIIRKYPHQQLTIDQICNLVGCSARSLHLGFKECYGTSPGRYARTLALNAAHQQLCNLPENETISNIAMSWGFYHLGRFSRQYKEFFSELPSATVKHQRIISVNVIHGS
ncbi:MAG: helix-turn-helix transcriptional regulator [Deltaproteobacteria bacterium]|nr:helix-turn-helix transcriptional regulator [Deltaproteobacteria bacterium]